MHPINGRAQIMVLQSNWKLPWIPHLQYQRNASAVSKKYWARSYTMPAMWTALFCNTIAEQQANPNQNTEAANTHFLDYAATNMTSIVQYKAGDIIIHINSDV